MSKRSSRRRNRRRGPRSVPDHRFSDAPCDAPGVEDGIDPRILFRHHYRQDTPPAATHRARQLAGQAAQALRFALQELDDPLLQSLDVTDVTVDGGGAALLVLVRPLEGSVPAPDEALRILDRLARVQSRLRTAVARAIRRRRVPSLRFRLAAETAGGER